MFKKYIKLIVTALLPVLYILIKERFNDFPIDLETLTVFVLWILTAFLNMRFEKTFQQTQKTLPK